MAEKKEESDQRIITLGKKITAMRKGAGYTNYEHIAWELGMGRAQYHRLEKGENFTIKTLLRVLDAYGMSPAEFFSDMVEAGEATLEKVASK